jgi:NTE family protein
VSNFDLVLEGGGVKGIGLVGAVSTLRRAGYELGDAGRVAGTSAGAIVGSMIAAGMPVPQLEQTMRTIDYRRFRDRHRFGLLGRSVSLLTRLGVYSGDWLHGWIKEQLALCGVHTFRDLKITNDPDSDLPPERSYRLVVIVSDVSRGRMLRLPWDYPRYGLDPDDQPVADAVRASASIPFFFRPVQLKPATSRLPSYCVDGGVLSNFPVTVFDRRDGRQPRWPTFGVKLSARPAEVSELADVLRVRGVLSLSKALIDTMVEAHDRANLDDPGVRERTIFVPTYGVRATDFDLDGPTRDQLYDSGRRSTERFLAGWDFATYRSRYAGIDAAAAVA